MLSSVKFKTKIGLFFSGLLLFSTANRLQIVLQFCVVVAFGPTASPWVHMLPAGPYMKYLTSA